MVKRLIVHIGTHKTGSTAIQGALSRSRQRLLDDGILYPETGRGRFGAPGKPQRFPGHANLARQAAGIDGFDPDEGGIDEVIGEVEDTHPEHVILSAEDFSTPRFQSESIAWVKEFVEKLGVGSVEIVVFLRPQWEYIESSYAQQIKSGLTHVRFPRFVESDLEHPRYDYGQILQAWSALGELTIVGYSGRATESVVDVFADRILPEGLELSTPPDRPNRRGGEKGIEMLRVLRGMLGIAGFPKGREKFFAARQRLASAFPNDPPWRGLTPELVARIREHHEEANAHLIERYDTDGSLEKLFTTPQDYPPPSSWTLARASNREANVFSGLVSDALGDTGPPPREDRSAELLNKGTFPIRPNSEHPEKRTVIVVGVPRGGTSMVAGVLERIGIPTGRGLVIEDRDLGNAFDEEDDDKFRKLVAAKNAEHDVWGWKRPSSYKRLAFVDESFRNPYYVAVFRDPLAVGLRENISMRSGTMKSMRGAVAAYQEIISFIDSSSRPVLCVSYDKALRYPEEFVRAVGEFVGVNVDTGMAEALEFIDPEPARYLNSSHRRKDLKK